MKNRLIIHIGFHKTATTTYQKNVFPNISNHKFLGRDFNGVTNSSSLYQAIMEYCLSGDEDPVQIKKIQTDLKKELEFNSLIISEEWFLSDYSGLFGFKGVCWQEKLTRLSQLINSLPHLIVVFVREPIDCLFSQYCEFQHVGINNYYKSFEDYVRNSNDAKAYDYKSLNNKINERFSDVTYVSFELLTNFSKSKKLFEQVIFKEKINTDYIEHQNTKKVESECVIIEKRSKGTFASLYDSFVSYKVRRFLKRIKVLRILKNYLYTYSVKELTVSLDEKKEVEKVFDFADSVSFYKSIVVKESNF
ncbi:MAG: hypothetical protein ACPGTQ_11255 [Colwellia sp.]